MKIYYFTVMIDSDHRGFYIKAKTLSDALKTLDSKLIDCYRGLTDWFNYRVCQTYSVLSESGKRSHRSLRRAVRGLV